MRLCHPDRMSDQDDPQQQDDELDIVGEAPSVDEYRLSSRPGTVSGPS